MLVTFDTSMLVASVLAHHPSDALAWPWVEAADQGKVEGY
jgi:hypothetical protein